MKSFFKLHVVHLELEFTLDGEELRLLWTIRNFKPQNDFKIIGGSSIFPLMRRSVADDMREMKESHWIMTSAELRYAKNKVYASYGHRFKNPFVRAQFYYPGSRYKERAASAEQKISKEHAIYIDWLSKLENDKLKAEKF